MSPLNGTPQPGKFPMKKINGGGKGRSGCLPALITIAILGTGWASMLWQGWTA